MPDKYCVFLKETFCSPIGNIETLAHEVFGIHVGNPDLQNYIGWMILDLCRKSDGIREGDFENPWKPGSQQNIIQSLILNTPFFLKFTGQNTDFLHRFWVLREPTDLAIAGRKLRLETVEDLIDFMKAVLLFAHS